MTIKQQKAYNELAVNGGNVTKAMISAGYSAQTAKTPKKLTESDGWRELLEKYIPDNLLNEKLVEGLDANKQLATRVIFKKDAPTSQSARELPAATGMTDDFIEVPDMQTRHKYLETAYKLKGRLKNNEFSVGEGGSVQINVISGGYISGHEPIDAASESDDIQSGAVQSTGMAQKSA